MSDRPAALERARRLHLEGRLSEALRAYEEVLRRHPADADTLHFAGVVLYQLGHADAAAARIQQSLARNSANAEAWCNLALAYETLGRIGPAISALREALRHEADAPVIWNNLASALLNAGDDGEAAVAARRAVALDERHAPGWFNLALALERLGDLDEALAAARRAAELAPGETAPAGLRAQLEETLGRFADARATLDAAIIRDPGSAALQFQRAGVLERMGELSVAAAACERVLRLEPAHGAALSDLLFLRKRLADWHDLPALRARFAQGVKEGLPFLSPFCLLSDPSSRAEQRRCAERWCVLLPTRSAPSHRRLSDSTLRIGYLSADFHQHATAVLAAGLFEQHDRRRFEIVAYSTGPDDASPMRSRLAAAFDRFVDARGWRPEHIAERIRADAIDILVDLKGHTQGAPTAVCALRPAPIQVSYLGYPGTMGAPFIDYLIGDAVVTPAAHAADYSETLVQLPGSYQVNDRARAIAEPPARTALGLPTEATVFCSFNSAFKFNPEVFDAWTRILHAVPGSILWLLARSAEPERDPVVANLRREAAARDIDPQRLVFASARPNAEYLGLYRHADLFLDTWPYNAHTTASDALWAGCPVLTWLGTTFAGRVAASVLTAVGLPDLVAAGLDGYVERAVALGRDPAARGHYRMHLSGPGRQSALFDTASTTRALEAAYLGMAQQYRSGTRAPFFVGGGALR